MSLEQVKSRRKFIHLLGMPFQLIIRTTIKKLLFVLSNLNGKVLLDYLLVAYSSKDSLENTTNVRISFWAFDDIKISMTTASWIFFLNCIVNIVFYFIYTDISTITFLETQIKLFSNLNTVCHLTQEHKTFERNCVILLFTDHHYTKIYIYETCRWVYITLFCYALWFWALF